jgi:alkanesulfonate monooxygenase SsuD/methylene tetrahydromethanopterin reductase-like flavin-dependent oxidoreductase (luciferase family)
MEFGVMFFPDVGPNEKSPAQYWSECLDLSELCDALGYSQIRCVEHYFEPYGGYSPSPLVFLAAAAQRTKKVRFITGAILPIFGHPLKLAGEIGMVDAISGGRLDCGFGRAFLPHEFVRFGIPMDESRARFTEGVAAIRALLERENVTFEGRYWQFKNVTSLPRPTQKPRPPIWTAALGTPDSVRAAGTAGDHLMLVAFAGKAMREAITGYRAAWDAAGHKGRGTVSIAFHMFCHEDRNEAYRIAKPHLTSYFRSLVEAMEIEAGWGKGRTSKDYPGYEDHTAKLRQTTFESMLESGTTLVGTPDDVARRLQDYIDLAGSFDAVTLQVNFHMMRKDDAANSMRLCAERVMPQFASK